MTVRPLSALMMASCLLVVVPAGAVFALQESPDPARAFDFEFGAWTVELSLLLEPLSGSDEWVEYRGTSVVGEVWGGEANLGELDVEGPEGRIRGLSLRLYDPASGQWRIHWANRRTGHLGPPMIGGPVVLSVDSESAALSRRGRPGSGWPRRRTSVHPGWGW